MADLFPYNGTMGYVEQESSKARAVFERDSGVASARARAVLDSLHARGAAGAIWREIGSDLGLHHGQVSGCLSVLHKAGHVFMKNAISNGCHIYVHSDFRDAFPDWARIDQPVVTKTKQRKDALEAVLAAAALVVTFDGTDRDSLDALRDAIQQVRDL